MKYKCRLNIIFAEREIKKTDFAKRVGINAGTLSSLVTNKSLPTFEVAMKVAEELELRVEDIWIKEQ